jgi:hypothetical protein
MSPRSPLPARYPPTGAWPAVMRADMAAAYLDYRDTNELARGVSRGERPHRSAITELDARENQSDLRPPLTTSSSRIRMVQQNKTWRPSYETTPHCIEAPALLPAKAVEEWSMGILF